MSDIEFSLPDVGEGLAEAEIVRWVVPEGGDLVRMEPMVEIETAKSVVEIPSPIDGVLVRHGAPEGASVDVGALLAVLSMQEHAPDASPSSAPVSRASSPAPSPAVDTAPAGEGPLSTARNPRVPAAPTVRRRAVRAGVDLRDVPATGAGGRVLAADLDAYVRGRDDPATAPEPETRPDAVEPTSVVSSTAGGNRTERPGRPGGGERTDRVEPLSLMRKGIATAMQRAWSEVPLITDLRDVDASRLVEAKRVLVDERAGASMTYTALFAAASLSALAAHPQVNASIDLAAGTVRYHGGVHLGIAVAVPDGLAVAVIRDADTLRLGELADALDDVSGRARAGRLTVSETTGATFTVSSFGQFGGWYGTPLVVPPQAAIAGFGPIKDAVVPVDGVPAVRPTLPLSVSADHRLIDGAVLSGFCSHVERVISDPLRLLVA